MAAQVEIIVRSCNTIANSLAMPVIFSYYHLMNVVLFFNILAFTLLPALYRTWATNVPLFIALLLHMGMREMSLSLADPIGNDGVDLPVLSFLDQTFDRCVCLLESFAEPDVRQRVLNQVEDVTPFTDEQLRHPLSPDAVYGSNTWNAKTVGWNRSPVVLDLDDQLEARALLVDSLRGYRFELDEEDFDAVPKEEEEEPQETFMEFVAPHLEKLKRERERGKRLRHELHFFTNELNETREQMCMKIQENHLEEAEERADSALHREHTNRSSEF